MLVPMTTNLKYIKVSQEGSDRETTREPGARSNRCPEVSADNPLCCLFRKAYGKSDPSIRAAAEMKGVGKFGEVMAGEKGKVSYDDVAARLQKIIHSGSQRKAITDFVCRELRKIPHYTWVGIYLVDGRELVLTSWSGPSATQHTRIPIGEGICGAAVAEKATVVVQDVSNDPRYLQCFINTRAEIVVPILRDGAPIAEIDIDSDQLNAFGSTDTEFLEWVASDLRTIL